MLLTDMLLADIGNTHFHIFDGKRVEHLSYDEAIKKYHSQKLYYITVKHQLTKEIEKISLWKNISSCVSIKEEYETMGVDRKALCLSHKEGIFIDAGSAITVDVVENGVYKGGFILLGIKAYLKGYETISLALKTNLNETVDLNALPKTTKDGISYGIIASIKEIVSKHKNGKKLYFTGGDGAFLSTFFKSATYDELLVFRGIEKILKEKKIC